MSKLEKLKIEPERKSGLQQIEALFNPNTYSITKSVQWSSIAGQGTAKANSTRNLNAPTLSFGGGQGRQLSLDLLFDSTEERDSTKLDVRTRTKEIVALTRIQPDLGRPPVCRVSWGAAKDLDFPFTGVISQLTQRFTLFRSDGTALRATLTVAFTEWVDPAQDLRETDPEFTTRLIKRGDSLSSIAAQVYGDPTVWRLLAEANQLDDPRLLTVGMRLKIPKA